jgi:endoglucanase
MTIHSTLHSNAWLREHNVAALHPRPRRSVPTERIKRAALSAATAALSLGLTTSTAFAQTPNAGAGYWHTAGNTILDANGAQVRIAGINWYGFETPDFIAHGLWAQDYKTILNTIKALGYNVVRIPFSNQMVESNPIPTNFAQYANGAPVNQALVGATAMQDLDTIVAYAGAIGLRVILDNHRSEAGESNEASGLWYTSAYPDASWIADWQSLAKRYSDTKFTFDGNPTVIGMDLRNEPHLIGSTSTSGACWTGDSAVNGCATSLTSQNWPAAATRAGNAILAVNPHLLIFVEGVDCYNGACGWQGGNLMGVATYPVTLNAANQLVYSAHDYGPNLYGQRWFNSSTTASSLDAIWNNYWGYISANGTAPVWLGEFGTGNNNADISNSTAGSQGQWFQSLIAYLHDNPPISWTYWALNGEDSYGLLDGNYDSIPVNASKQADLASIQFPLTGGSTNPPPPPPPPAMACHVTYTITNQWPGGFGTTLSIQNTGNAAIQGWTLTWSFPNGQTITQLWNGSVSQSGASVTVRNLSYNGTILAGGTYTGVGFNGTWDGAANGIPASFAVNGVACE